MSDVKPVAWGLFARVDGKFVLQHPVRFSREYCERDVKMYGPDLVWNIQPLIAGGEVTALQAEIEALRQNVGTGRAIIVDLLDQIDSLQSYELTRDLEGYKAQAIWDSAIENAKRYAAIAKEKQQESLK